MQSKLLDALSGQKTFALIFETGDEVMKRLQGFAVDNHLRGSSFTGIGAFRSATLAWFDWERKEYKRIPVAEQVELVSLMGDIAIDDRGAPQIHAHAVLGRSDGSTLGGHLLEGHVRPTLELVVRESLQHLQRRHDPQSGLALIRF